MLSATTQDQMHTINYNGLTDREVAENRKLYGQNELFKKKLNVLMMIIRQVKDNPLIIVLTLATIVSFSFGEKISSIYILWMIVISIFLGFWNEYSAEKTVDNLLKRISHKVFVWRNNQKTEVDIKDIVANDIVFLNAGNIVPADIEILESKNLELDEAALTGESESVYKVKGADIFMGTVVLAGWGIGKTKFVGKNTQYGKIAQEASFIKPETDFQKGLNRFSQLLVKVIFLLTFAIFVCNIILGKDLLTAVLFGLAIAVGLTPELLPVIVTISLSHGAGKLAKKHVIAKQLVSIENLGNMDILCTDKTGTLTEGKIQLVNYFPENSPTVIEYSLLCNSADVGKKIQGNPIDTAIWEFANKRKIKINKSYKEIFEKSFDYEKKAAFTVFCDSSVTSSTAILITKGAPEEILSKCTNSASELREKNLEYVKLSSEGYRVIAVATTNVQVKQSYTWDEVKNLTFVGFLSFMDTPKKNAKEAIQRLKELNVSVKILTGDNELVTRKICSQVGIPFSSVLKGDEMSHMSEEELEQKVANIDIFARVSPEQKLKVIQLLRKKGHTVGYLGDGVNDIPSLHSADVGISVDTAVDVAKDSASIVLLKKGLDVIAEGVLEGRRTFNNTIKYILMSTSSNFGNMFSAAGASFFLPFLPMTPTQILLNNSLYDFAQMSIPTDNVDEVSLLKPRHWNIEFIKKYMLFFGPISSLYDFLTFAVMYFVFKSQVSTQASMFHTGWFVESLATQVLVVFVIRTSKSPFFKSKPGKWLTIVSLSVVLLGVFLPFSPLAKSLGFVPLPPLYFLILTIMLVAYLAMVEGAKKLFLKRYVL